MKQMLQREEELRMSPEYHEEISQRDTLQNIRDVTMSLQDRVLREFGYGENFIMAFNRAREQYLFDPEMNKITVYQRQDRSRKGDLFSGSELPDAELTTLDGKSISLHNYINQIQGNSRPLVLTAGSIT